MMDFESNLRQPNAQAFLAPPTAEELATIAEMEAAAEAINKVGAPESTVDNGSPNGA